MEGSFFSHVNDEIFLQARWGQNPRWFKWSVIWAMELDAKNQWSYFGGAFFPL